MFTRYGFLYLLCSGYLPYLHLVFQWYSVIAYIFAGRNFRGKELAELSVTFPLILPHAAIVYFLVILIGGSGFLGQLIYNFFGSRFQISRITIIILILRILPA